MNELQDIADKLYNKYGNDGHWVITRAEKTDQGSWVLVIHEEKKQPKKAEAKKEGAKNDNNK